MGLSLKNDVIFKAVFGSETEESKQALIGMLNLILDRKDPIRKIIYKNPFNVREFEIQKESILDVKAETDSGEIIDIEMQLVYDEEFIPRDVYYHCGMVRQGLAVGESYGMLKKTISIYLMDHVWFRNEEKWHSCFQLREKEDGTLLTDLVEMHYFELPKINPGRRRTMEEMTDAERFLEYLRFAGSDECSKDDYFKFLMRTGGKEMEMTQAVLQKVTEDELLREKAIARDKFLFMQASLERQRERTKKELAETSQQLGETLQQLEEANQQLESTSQQLEDTSQQLEEKERRLEETESQLRNVQQEVKDNRIDTASKLKMRGMSIDEISEITGLSIEEIEVL